MKLNFRAEWKLQLEKNLSSIVSGRFLEDEHSEVWIYVSNKCKNDKKNDLHTLTDKSVRNTPYMIKSSRTQIWSSAFGIDR